MFNYTILDVPVESDVQLVEGATGVLTPIRNAIDLCVMQTGEKPECIVITRDGLQVHPRKLHVKNVAVEMTVVVDPEYERLVEHELRLGRARVTDL